MRIAIAVVVMTVVVAVSAVLLSRARIITRIRKVALVLYLTGQMLAASYLFYLAIVYDLSMAFFGLSVFMGLLCVLASYALYHVLEVAEDRREAKEHVRLLEEQGKALKAQQKKLDSETKKARLLQNELIAELKSVLAGYEPQANSKIVNLEDNQPIKDNNPDFTRVLQIVDAAGRRVCQHHVIGALLASKQEEAQSKRIRVEFDLNVPDNLPFSDTELCAVFSNLFDNASNACELLPVDERFIDMKAYSRGTFFVINTRNSCSKKKPKHTERKKTKFLSEHGWGLSIIEAVAERHGGLLETEQKNNCFHTTVVMSLEA